MNDFSEWYWCTDSDSIFVAVFTRDAHNYKLIESSGSISWTTSWLIGQKEAQYIIIMMLVHRDKFLKFTGIATIY